MQEPYLGTILPWTGHRIPTGWLPCDGRQLAVNGNQALFTLLGARYGGDGRTNFNLPNLSCRFPQGAPNSAAPGAQTGTASITLTQANLPAHTHTYTAAQVTLPTRLPDGSTTASAPAPTPPTFVESKSVFAKAYPAIFKPYTPAAADTEMGGLSVTTNIACGSVGSTAPINTLPPYATCIYIIAVQGYYPTRD